MNFRVRCGAIDLDQRVVRRDAAVVELTPVEVAVLRYLQARVGQVVLREDLLRDVWGYARQSRSRAIHVALRRLRAKIEVDPSEPDHLQTVAGVGWRFVLPVEPPADGDPLVGRDGALADLRAVLVDEPLVVLVGPGGIGKTRLARAVDGTFCDLTTARTVDDLQSAVVRAIGGPIATLRTAGLVVLDNLEQIAEVAAEPLAAWVAAGARLLVTSRVRLSVHGACTVAVGPLDDQDGIALFVRRARAAGCPEPLASDDTLLALVRGLEGNPLCLELAASRTRVLTVAQILDRLTDRFAVLRTREAGRPERHLALEATLDGSWQLLSDDERAALSALTTFRGPFSIDAAEVVVGDGALDRVQELIDASLIRRVGDRIGFYVAVQEYVERRAPASSEAQVRHGGWFASRETLDAADVPDAFVAAERAIAREDRTGAVGCVRLLGFLVQQLTIPGIDGLLDIVLPWVDGPDRARLLRAAAARAVDRGEGEHALVLLQSALSGDTFQDGLVHERIANLSMTLGRYDDAEQALRSAREAFEVAGRPVHRGSAIVAASNLMVLRGRLPQALVLIEEAVAAYRGLEEPRGLAIALANLAIVRGQMGDPAASERAMRDAIGILERFGDAHAAGRLRVNLGAVLVERGAVDEAEAQGRRALRTLGPAGALLSLFAEVARSRGDLDAARGWLLDAVATAERRGDRRQQAVFRSELARVVAVQGDAAGARALLDEAIAELAVLGDVPYLVPALCARAGPGDVDRAAALVAEAGLGDDSPAGRAVAAAR